MALFFLLRFHQIVQTLLSSHPHPRVNVKDKSLNRYGQCPQDFFFCKVYFSKMEDFLFMPKCRVRFMHKGRVKII